MAGRRISGYGVELGACPVHEGLRRLHGSLGILRTEHIHRCRITESIGVADPPRFQAFERVAQRKIRQLEIAGQLDDLRVPPGNCLEALRAIAWGSTASASTTNSACALDGQIQGLRPLQPLTTTHEIHASTHSDHSRRIAP
jgi:hypothetical protein